MTAPLPLSSTGSLERFAPGLRGWLTQRFPAGPTASQRLAFPTILDGRHVLLTAPTGNGKTLAAHAPLWQQLLEDVEEPTLRCLHISPLRALCNDLFSRLSADLGELKAWVGPAAWKLTVGLYTGDRKPSEKRKLIDHPPRILVTTPESLTLLLAHPRGSDLLRTVRHVIIDEAHALAANKRGADLAISLERLADLTEDDPQRIGLSATCAPVAAYAGWLGGANRHVQVLSIPNEQRLYLDIADLTTAAGTGAFLPTLLDRLMGLIARYQTLLVFTNVRSLCERIAWALKRRLPGLAEQIAVHHGSLAKARREVVEGQLQRGELRVICSSTSLELGIDIGSIDHVAFVHAPGGAARLLQRLGRAGHRPGGSRSGTLFVASSRELLEAVVTRAAGQDAWLEPVGVPRAPLDVLCQQLVGMGVSGRHSAARAWTLVRQAAPFNHLTLAEFSRCLEYLLGGSRGARVPARLRLRDHQLRSAHLLTPRIYRTNAGTIQDEPHCLVRLHQEQTVLGTVPDRFADRLMLGDRFLLNGRVYELLRQERLALFVEEAGGIPSFTRWNGNLWNGPPELARRMWQLRHRLGGMLLDGDQAALRFLAQEYGVIDAPAQALLRYLHEQQQCSEIPGTELLVEATALPDGELAYYAFHLPLTASACEGIARVLNHRLRAGQDFPVEPGPLGFLITLPSEIELTPQRLRILLAADHFQEDLQRSIVQSPVLARRFMEAAHNGLMLLRRPLRGKQRKVGGSRWGGDKLLHWLRFADRDFPLLQQAQTETCEDYFQAAQALAYLQQVQEQSIRLRWLAEPSPFAAEWLPPTTSASATDGGDLQDLLLTLSAGTETGDPRAWEARHEAG